MICGGESGLSNMLLRFIYCRQIDENESLVTQNNSRALEFSCR